MPIMKLLFDKEVVINSYAKIEEIPNWNTYLDVYCYNLLLNYNYDFRFFEEIDDDKNLKDSINNIENILKEIT